MGGSKQSKRVYWAPEGELCQVRLSQPDHCSSQGRRRVQIPTQVKQLSKDNKSNQPSNMLGVKSTQIPVIKWRCPPKFQVSSEWQVAAGEESEEKETQNQKPNPPQPWTVPLKRSSAMEPIVLISDEQNTPLIPLVPIEEHHPAPDTSDSVETLSSQETRSTNPQASGVVSASQAGTIPDLLNSDLRYLIDLDLLKKILTNPKMIQELISLVQNASVIAQNNPSSCYQNIPSTTSQCLQTAAQSVQNLTSPPKNSIVPIKTATENGPFHPTVTGTPTIQHMPNLKSAPKNSDFPINTSTANVPFLLAEIIRKATANVPFLLADMRKPTANVPFLLADMRKPSPPSLRPHAPPNVVISSGSATGAAPPVEKGRNYYRTLIQLHGGGERRDILPESRQGIYSNSSCAYQPDAWAEEHVSVQEVNSQKRMRPGRQNLIVPQKRMKLDTQMTSAPWFHPSPVQLSYSYGW